MTTGIKDNEFLMRCSCHNSDHFAWLIHEPDDSRGNNLKGEDDDWYLSVSLSNFGFWKRLGKAARYVFRPLSLKYGMTAELVLRTEDVTALEDFIRTRRST